jgi:DNA-binding PadR family transcriptional regulator
MAPDVLSTLDLLVLLAVLRLEDEAYGVSIADAVGTARGRAVSMAAVYVALERLEERGFVVTELGEPTAARGGRAKRYVRVTRSGLTAVKATRRALTRLWSGVPALKDRTT